MFTGEPDWSYAVIAPPPIVWLRKAVVSSPSTCWFDGSPVSVRMPKLEAVAVPVIWMVSVRLLAPTLMLPLVLSSVAVPPVSVFSAACSSAIVETSPAPVPNAIDNVGFDPTLMSIV